MATLTQRRRFDDEDVLDDFDPAYFPKRVYKDGRGPRVRLMLTDGRPDWMPPIRPAFDASNHQPHQVRALSDEQMRDARAASEAAYEVRSRWLADAYRTMPGGPGGTPRTTAPAAAAGKPDGDDETLSPRDRYIRRLQTAYRTPPGQPDQDDDDANAIEVQREAWLKPGASPGGGNRQTKDAAADRDAAYGEYLDRISNGWRR